MLTLVPLAFIRGRDQIYSSVEVVKVKSVCITFIISKEKETDQRDRKLGSLRRAPTSSDVIPILEH